MPSIIVKFVHFNDKTEIYKNRRMLKSLKNEINNKNICMKERLPPLDAFVKKLAENKDLIAVRNNCRVPVMCKNNSGNNVYVKVNNASGVDNLRHPVVRNVGRSKTFPNNTRNPFKRPHNLMMTDDDKNMRLYASKLSDQKRLMREKLNHCETQGSYFCLMHIAFNPIE